MTAAASGVSSASDPAPASLPRGSYRAAVAARVARVHPAPRHRRRRRAHVLHGAGDSARAARAGVVVRVLRRSRSRRGRSRGDRRHRAARRRGARHRARPPRAAEPRQPRPGPDRRHRAAALDGLRLRDRVRPRDEHRLRGRGGPPVLDLPRPDAAGRGRADRHPDRHRRDPARHPGGGRRHLRAARASLPSSPPPGTGASGRCCWCSLVLFVACSTTSPRTCGTRACAGRASDRSPRSRSGWSRRSGSRSTSSIAGHYDALYGSLGGIVIALLWGYLTNAALVAGAELDAEFVRLRQLARGEPAEEIVRLPLRDSSRNRMLARQRDQDVAAARRIREQRRRRGRELGRRPARERRFVAQVQPAVAVRALRHRPRATGGSARSACCRST